MNLSIEEIKDMLVNPYYAINVSDVVATPHETLITKEQWIQAFVISVMQNDEAERLQAPEDIEARLRDALGRVLNNLESSNIPLGYKEGKNNS